MRRMLLLGTGVLLALVPFGSGAPVDGPAWMRKRIETNGTFEIARPFVAGQRACVIAIGDHKPVVPLQVTVYDKRDNVVAEDKGGEGDTGDYVAAIWYPAREEMYRIVIRSPGVEYNECSIAIK